MEEENPDRKEEGNLREFTESGFLFTQYKESILGKLTVN